MIENTINDNLKVCNNCRLKNWLIECECRCGELLTYRNKQGYKRRFIKGHENRGRSGDRANNWRGGRHPDTFGYIMIYKPEHPFADNHGCVREHRLIMEKHLGRYLTKQEEIHHIDGNKKNNEISNLLLTDRSNHARIEFTGNKYRLISNRDKRTCYFDETHKTYTRNNGFMEWYKYRDNFMCSSCYHKERKKLFTPLDQ